MTGVDFRAIADAIHAWHEQLFERAVLDATYGEPSIETHDLIVVTGCGEGIDTPPASRGVVGRRPDGTGRDHDQWPGD